MLNAKEIYALADKCDFKAIKELCIVQIRTDEAEKAGKQATSKTRITALKNCLSKDNVNLMKSFMEEDKHCFCNGYLGIVMNEVVPEIPIGEKTFKMKMVESVEQANCNGYLESASAIKTDITGTIADFKVRKMQDKKSEMFPTVIEKTCKIGFNPIYMNDAIMALGGYDEVNITYPERATNPIYLESHYGMGMVLPIKIKE